MNDMIIKCDIFLKKLVQNKISHIKKIITFVLIDKMSLSPDDFHTLKSATYLKICFSYGVYC